MKTLYLPLNAKWYEMIESGEKKEEYREIKQYWCTRIGNECGKFYHQKFINGDITYICSYTNRRCRCKQANNYTHVRFSYGYTRRTMTFEIESISIGKGKPEWGAAEEDVFIIKLGKKL